MNSDALLNQHRMFGPTPSADVSCIMIKKDTEQLLKKPCAETVGPTAVSRVRNELSVTTVLPDYLNHFSQVKQQTVRVIIFAYLPFYSLPDESG